MLNDFRFGARVLWKNPGFTAAAAITLAAGVGLNATLFSIVNFLLFKPLPVASAHELVWIAGAAAGPERPRERFTLPDVLDFRSAQGAIADVIAFGDTRMAVRAGTRAVRVDGQVVTPNYFAMLGVSAAEGRVLSAADDRADGEMAAVISHGLGQRLFGSPRAAVGQPIEVNGQTFRVVGVAGRGFSGTDLLSPADAWVPMAAAAPVAGVRDPQSRTTWWLRAMARLAPGVTVPHAQAAAGAIAGSIARTYPESHEGFAVRLAPARGAGPHDRGALAPLAVLPAVPLAILLIACANVAGLLLSRGVSRTREIAVRMALGASRRQIVRQLLAESLLLALLGCAGSLLILLWSPDLLVRLVGAPLVGDLSPDARVLLFTFALAVTTALVFGLAPALRAARGAGPAALRTGPGAGLGRTTRLQRVLVAGQLALSLVLLSASGQFIQSLFEASRVNVGFETEGRVTLSLDLKMQRYSRERAAAFYRALLERAPQLPGIRSAAYASYVPLGGRVAFTPVYVSGQVVNPDDRPPMTAVNMVSAGFFETFQMPIVRGRALDARDAAPGAAAAVVNETFARTFVPGVDPIGQRFRLEGPGAPAREIVGVARDVVMDEFGEDPRPFTYVPHDGDAGEIALLAWATTDGGAALRALEGAVREIDPAVAVFEPRTMAQHLADRMDGERGLARLLGCAAALSLGLAAFGLYGVIAHMVTRRTQEIGVRMALGARAEDVVRLFVRDGARVVMWGLGVGALPAAGAGILLSNALYGVHPADVRALGAAALVLAAIAALASYVPARRVMRVDPMIALRTE